MATATMQHNAGPMRLFIPITKIDTAQRIVYGRLTAEVADKTGEIFDYATGKEAFITWSNDALERSQGKSKGNLRAMHGKIAAGKFNDIFFDDENKAIDGAAKVSDDQEWAKVEDGTYTGFSIGGDYAKRWIDPVDANLMRYTPILAEVSLVDNPCVASATFQVIKADGSTETRKFKTTEEQTPMPAENLPQNTADAEQVWKSADGSTHPTKALAVAKSAEHAAAQAVQPLTDAIAELGAVIKAATDEPGEPKAETGTETLAEPEKPADDTTAAIAEPIVELPVEVPPSEPQKSFSGRIKKGMGSVSQLACLISDLNWLQDCMEYETIAEGDDSQVAIKLDVILKELCELLMECVQEETSEMFPMAAMDKAKAIEVLAKKGARHSAKDMEMMAKAHDHASEVQKCMKAMGYGDDDEKDADKAILGQMQKMADENESLKKTVTSSVELLQSMAKQVEQIANSPAPRKGVLKSVGKTDDVVATTDDSANATDKTDAISLIKLSHRNPINITK